MVHVQGWLVTWKVIGDFYARMCDKCRNIIESSSMLIELLNSFTISSAYQPCTLSVNRCLLTIYYVGNIHPSELRRDAYIGKF